MLIWLLYEVKAWRYLRVGRRDVLIQALVVMDAVLKVL